jgi:hypothetical protein
MPSHGVILVEPVCGDVSFTYTLQQVSESVYVAILTIMQVYQKLFDWFIAFC